MQDLFIPALEQQISSYHLIPKRNICGLKLLQSRGTLLCSDVPVKKQNKNVLCQPFCLHGECLVCQQRGATRLGKKNTHHDLSLSPWNVWITQARSRMRTYTPPRARTHTHKHKCGGEKNCLVTREIFHENILTAKSTNPVCHSNQLQPLQGSHSALF